MFFVNYLPEFLYQPLKLSNVRPTDFANSKHALLQKRSILVICLGSEYASVSLGST